MIEYMTCLLTDIHGKDYWFAIEVENSYYPTPTVNIIGPGCAEKWQAEKILKSFLED